MKTFSGRLTILLPILETGRMVAVCSQVELMYRKAKEARAPAGINWSTNTGRADILLKYTRREAATLPSLSGSFVGKAGVEWDMNDAHHRDRCQGEHVAKGHSLMW